MIEIFNSNTKAESNSKSLSNIKKRRRGRKKGIIS